MEAYPSGCASFIVYVLVCYNPPSHVVLATIEREQRVEGDLQEAIRLQVHETDAHEALVVDPVQQEQTFEDDFAYALHLQELENQAAAAAGSKPADENDTSEDHALAMALQAEMNAVHDRAISDREAIANNFGRSKVRISMDQFRTYPSEQREAGHEVSYVSNLSAGISTS